MNNLYQIFFAKNKIFFSLSCIILWTIFFSFPSFSFSFPLSYSIIVNIFDETGYTITSAPPPSFLFVSFFLFHKTSPLPIFPIFSLKLIQLWSNLRWNLIYLIATSLDHLPRWSQSKPISPITIPQTYIYFPLFSFFVFFCHLSLDPFYPPISFFTFSPILYLFSQ